ncbi:MAG: N-acetylglucosamine-6-phosphate deacetylase [Candidatus Aminicenantes bacterium]|jgi:N-acetylglucosamine-6-phosphate deacetylase
MSEFKLIKNCDIHTPLRVIKNGSILIQGKKIAKVGQVDDSKIPQKTQIFDFKQKLAVPGFIDIHLHGGGGVDFLDSSPDSIVKALKIHLKNGTTSLLPSIMTTSHKHALDTIRAFIDIKRSIPDIPDIIGLNLEGPYISMEKSGAHRTQYIRKPSLIEVQEYIKASEGNIRIMTVAPEIEGMSDIIHFLSKQNVILSAGHTNANYEQTQQAVNSGVRLATHLFNAMRGIAHREPGAAGALLLNDDVYTEAVADGIHLHPSILELIARVKPIEKIILVTDASKYYGISQEASYTRDGKLLGSTTALSLALKNMTQFTGIPFDKILRMVTINPAKLLRVESQKGSIKRGCDADIIILDKEMNLSDVFSRGMKFIPS